MGANEILAGPTAAEMESLLAFWAEAGVSYALEDAPQDRLAVRLRRGAREEASAAPPLAPSPPPSAEADLARRAVALAAGVSTIEELDEARTRFLEIFAAETGRPAPFGSLWRVGRADAPVVVVTDFAAGPDAVLDVHEDRLFSAMTAAAGLDERLMTCALAPMGTGDKLSAAEVLALGRPFVLRLLAERRPSLVLVLGAAAAAALGAALEPDEETSRTVGTLTAGEARIRTLVTLHPRFLLRQPLGKKRVWADLLMLKSYLRMGDGRSPGP